MSGKSRIDEFLVRLEEVLLACWSETGFGQLTIESERITDTKIRVLIKGSTHYRYIITEEEVRNRLSKRRNQAITHG